MNSLVQEIHLISGYLTILEYHNLRIASRGFNLDKVARIRFAAYKESLEQQQNVDISRYVILIYDEITIDMLVYLVRAGDSTQITNIVEKNKIHPDTINEALIVAIDNVKSSPCTIIPLLKGINKALISPNADFTVLFKVSIHNGFLKLIGLLIDGEYLEVTDDFHSDAILIASLNGYFEIVELLLTKTTLDPSARSNLALQHACENGHFNIVKLLLADSRVDPNDADGMALSYAAEKGHLQICSLLLKDHRVDPSGNQNSAICYASRYGHLDIVQLLLKDPRVDPSAHQNYSIIRASEFGYFDIVRLLLTDKRVDPPAERSSALKCAVINGYIDIVQLLLADSRVNSKIDDNFCLKVSIDLGNIEVTNLLLKHQQCSDGIRALKRAYNNCDWEMFKSVVSIGTNKTWKSIRKYIF